MSAAFTPGPWRVSSAKDGSHYVLSPSGCVICNVSRVLSYKKAHAANAALLAAAPELLSALVSADAMLTRLMNEYNMVARGDLTDIRAAIAKARGQS